MAYDRTISCYQERYIHHLILIVLAYISFIHDKQQLIVDIDPSSTDKALALVEEKQRGYRLITKDPVLIDPTLWMLSVPEMETAGLEYRIWHQVPGTLVEIGARHFHFAISLVRFIFPSTYFSFVSGI